MRSLLIFAPALLLAAAAGPALSQTATPAQNTLVATSSSPASVTAAPAALPSDSSDASINYAALREQVAQQNKQLTEQVAARRAVVRKNQELLKEAQKLHAQNQKLLAERQKLEAQNTDLEKQRDTLKSQQKPAAE